MRGLSLLLWATASALPLAATAHPLAPALLELRETGPGQYAVQWRVSALRAPGETLTPVLPDHCTASSGTTSTMEQGQAWVSRWNIRCQPESLVNRSLTIAGLERSGINVILHLEDRDGAVTQALLDAGRPGFTVPAPQAKPSVFRAYLGLGVEHLLLGLDHALFVLGLVLLVGKLRPLILTLTAFTLGHSLTLALATLGFVQVNPAVTETGIALSLLVLALEAARPAPQRQRSLLARWPWAVACAFGLLHGLGFAGALSEIGLPLSEIPLALLAFNLGIELGQLLIVAALLLLAALWRMQPMLLRQPLPAGSKLLPAYVMGSLAAYWCIERSSLLFQ